MRLFLALELPDAAVRRLVALQEELGAALSGWRWLPASSLHLTLRFLGEVTPEADRAQRAGWRLVVAAHPSFGLQLGEVGVLPGRAPARVLYAGVSAAAPEGAPAALAQALEGEARRVGYEPEERSFRPHVTLARALPHVRPAAPASAVRAGPIEAFCSEVTLFCSDLSPQGATYAALERFPLDDVGLDPARRARQHGGAREGSAEEPAATRHRAEPRS